MKILLYIIDITTKSLPEIGLPELLLQTREGIVDSRQELLIHVDTTDNLFKHPITIVPELIRKLAPFMCIVLSICLHSECHPTSLRCLIITFHPASHNIAHAHDDSNQQHLAVSCNSGAIRTMSPHRW